VLKKDLIKQMFQNKQKIQESVNNQNQVSYSKDETYWSPPWDATKKSGFALIAFLPFGNCFDETDQELSPYIFTPVHNNMTGKNGKKYYNIFCPSGRRNDESKECPICNKFFDFYNGSESDKKLAQTLSLGRKREYRGNIIVLKNDSNPEEVGKIFKWKFGYTIQQKINSKMNPIDGDEPVMIHNLYDIVPFKVKIIEKGGFRNYDTSEWGTSGKTVADYIIPDASSSDKEKYIEDILDKLYRTEDFITDKDYRSIEELERVLNDVLSSHDLDTVQNSNDTKQETIEKEVHQKPSNIGKELELEESIEEDPFEESSSNSTVSDDIDLESIFND
jgi:hypothetical protein